MENLFSIRFFFKNPPSPRKNKSPAYSSLFLMLKRMLYQHMVSGNAAGKIWVDSAIYCRATQTFIHRIGRKMPELKEKWILQQNNAEPHTSAVLDEGGDRRTRTSCLQSRFGTLRFLAVSRTETLAQRTAFRYRRMRFAKRLISSILFVQMILHRRRWSEVLGKMYRSGREIYLKENLMKKFSMWLFCFFFPGDSLVMGRFK